MARTQEPAAQLVNPSVQGTPWQAIALELIASLVAAGALVMIPLHYLSVRVTFFGVQAVIHDEDVRTYWTLVGVLAVAVLASFAAALWRKGDKSLAWHTLVAIAGVVVALVFSVTEAGLVQDLDGEPTQREQPTQPGNSVCHSGGDSDECVGG